MMSGGGQQSLPGDGILETQNVTFVSICILVIVGVLCKRRIQTIYIPSAALGGLAGILCVHAWHWSPLEDMVVTNVADSLNGVSEFLLRLLFIALCECEHWIVAVSTRIHEL